ncbi:lysylphosphatidylglycerol synthase transmembrane domain-containing protein [Kallotenue papyrolyticum]|uniref:lysylphosphatidylglycerol synthase transmembrane domain-containing protein n=1 Tax=Kallotenue papyrolyticum TaxID=1325125 RepID=UPI000492CD99|nr:lysylphosphatidylglycerol synthase transmembrane domain-containing protein [Kallotenue papyrolyticum]
MSVAARRRPLPGSRLWTWLLRLLGPALLLYFLVSIDDPALIWRTLLATDPWLLTLAIVLAAPFLLLKALRWLYLLRIWSVRLPLREALALYCIGIFLGVVTPGQAGDAVKAWYLRRRGYPLSTGLASVVVDRLFDIGVMGLLAASGLFFFWNVLPGGQLLNALVVAALLAGVGVALALSTSRRLRDRCFGLVARRLPRRWQTRWHASALRSLHLTPAQILWLTALTVAGLFWTFLRVYLLFLALDTPLPPGPFVALVAILALIQPATPGGVGTRDAALVVVLSALLDLSRDAAIARALALSALLLLLNLENVLIGFLYSLRYPLDELRREAVAS